MRDSFGGVFMLNLFLVFIFIYVAFTAVSLNYARAFKVKNAIIDFVETNEIIDFTSNSFLNKLEELEQLLSNADYYYQNTFLECSNTNGVVKNQNGAAVGYCYNGIKIEEIERTTVSGTTSEIIKYSITTQAGWNLGALNKLLALGGQDENSEGTIFGIWYINGEAKVVSKELD